MKFEKQNESFLSRLQNAYSELSSNNRKLADFISENIDEVILLSAVDVAKHVGVSESTVVRFAQSLGYLGYPDLKQDLIKFYREQMTPDKKFQAYLKSIQNNNKFYSKIANQEIEYLQQSVATIDDDVIDQAAKLIIEANHRYVYTTSGSNDALARNLDFRLNRFRLRTTAIYDSGVRMFERFPQFTPNDFIIIYSFYKPRADHIAIMDFLKKRKIPNLLITDSLTPAIVENADIVLFARRGPFGVFHSHIIPMAITNALLVAVAQKLGNLALDALEDLDLIRQQYNNDN